jgi:hypothetical protein
MNTIYAISFFNKKHLQFNIKDYNILKSQWFDKYDFNRNFHVIGAIEVPDFIFSLKNQQNYFLKVYEHPGPIKNTIFEDRKTITINGSELILNPAIFEHFRIHQLNDIIEELELSMISNQQFYIIPRKNFLNDYHLPLIYRVRHFLKEGGSKMVDLQKRIKDEFSTKVSLDFFYEVLADLDDLELILIKNEIIKKAKYFDFFY